MLAGAVVAVLPGLVVAIVNLFYNSAGGVLLLLGSLLSLLPHPAVSNTGSGSLPGFQVLTADTAGVLLRSGAATLLCSLALVLLAVGARGMAQTDLDQRGRDRLTWSAVAICCGLAAMIGGQPVALALLPALLISILRLFVGIRQANRP